MRDSDSTIVSWSWRSDRTIVLKPCGEIDGARARLLRAVVRRAMAQTSPRIVIDMSNVTTPDRETTALLTTLRQDANEARTRLELVGLYDRSEHQQRGAVASQR
jgi:anti-anti-sigma factor